MLIECDAIGKKTYCPGGRDKICRLKNPIWAFPMFEDSDDYLSYVYQTLFSKISTDKGRPMGQLAQHFILTGIRDKPKSLKSKHKAYNVDKMVFTTYEKANAKSGCQTKFLDRWILSR